MKIFYPMFLALAMVLPVSVWAQPTAPQTKPMAHTAVAKQVESYFNGMTTLSANFTQTQSDATGVVQRGTFLANRPKGQFVWQYVTPTRQKVVGNGTAVYYIDQSSKAGEGQVTQLPLDAGMGRLLRGGALNLKTTGLKVQSSQTQGSQTQVVLVPNTANGVANQTVRRIELAFANLANQPTLQGFAATDALGVIMRISLTEVKEGIAIPAKTFAYTPPLQRVR